MISIEKSYYSSNTNKVMILLYNDEPDVVTFDSVIDSISLVKYSESGEYRYPAIYDKVEFNIEPVSGDAFECLLSIVVDSENIEKSSPEYPDFDIEGITGIMLSLTTGTISSVVLDPTEIYSYKLNIINSEYGYQSSVRINKKMTRFSFYEQLLYNAIELGFEQDSIKYYNELKRMASYGIPKVRQKTCYI